MVDTKMEVVISLKDQISDSLKKVQSNLQGIKNRTMEAADASSTFAKGLTGAVAAIAGVGFIGVKFEAEIETVRQGLITLLGSAEEAEKTLARIKQEATRTPFEVEGLSRAVQLMASVTKDGDKAIDVILDVGEGLAAMGKGQNELDRIIVNLQQIAAVGKAATIDIKQFAFAGIPIYEMLTQQTGLAGEALESFIEEGGVTFDFLTKMFDSANDAGGRFFKAFENQTGTLNQQWSNFKDTLNQSLGQLVQQTGAFDALKSALAGLILVLPPVVQALTSVVLFFQNNQTALLIFAGIITGALIPSLVSLAAAAYATFVALAPFMLAGAAIAGIIAGITLLVKNWDIISAKIQEFGGKVIDDLYAKISSGFTLISDFFSSILDTIQKIFTITFDAIKTILTFWLAFVVGIFQTIFSLFGVDFVETMTQFGAFFVEKLTEVTAFLQNFFAKFIAIWNIYTVMLRTVYTKMWSDFKSNTSEFFDWVIKLVTSVTEPVKNVFSALWNAVKDATVGVFQSMVDVIKGMINQVFEMINKLIKAANKVAQTGAGALGIDIPKIPEIPLLAKGGIVKNPTLAMVGEAGPEAVIPLNKAEGMGFGGGVTINILDGNFLGNEEDVAIALGDIIVNRLKLSTSVV